MKIIGINGLKRSGKGETALAVERLYPDLNVKGVGFADKLKILAAKTLGFVGESDARCIELMDEAKESWVVDIKRNVTDDGFSLTPYNPGRLSKGWSTTEQITNLTGRQYLQNLGNEARKVFGDTFWIDQVLPNLAEASKYEYHIQNALESRYPGVDVLCITDLRYENEAQRIKALGGTIWEVLRPGTGSDGHASEQPLPRELVDYQILNDGSLEILDRYVTEALDETVGL